MVSDTSLSNAAFAARLASPRLPGIPARHSVLIENTECRTGCADRAHSATAPHSLLAEGRRCRNTWPCCSAAQEHQAQCALSTVQQFAPGPDTSLGARQREILLSQMIPMISHLCLPVCLASDQSKAPSCVAVLPREKRTLTSRTCI